MSVTKRVWMGVSDDACELMAESEVDKDSMLSKSRSVRGAIRQLALEKHEGLFDKYGLKPGSRLPIAPSQHPSHLPQLNYPPPLLADRLRLREWSYQNIITQRRGPSIR